MRGALAGKFGKGREGKENENQTCIRRVSPSLRNWTAAAVAEEEERKADIASHGGGGGGVIEGEERKKMTDFGGGEGKK